MITKKKIKIIKKKAKTNRIIQDKNNKTIKEEISVNTEEIITEAIIIIKGTLA